MSAPVPLVASVLTSDLWTEGCQVLPDVNTLTRNAATTAYEQAGDRQIADAKVGLAHVIGLGSACAVHILERSAA